MARNVQSLFRITSNVLKVINSQQICVFGSRTLYSSSMMGLDSYVRKRETIQQQFTNIGDKFREKMQTYLSEESKNLVFTEDLKNIVHLVENNPEDMDLMLKMIVKFNNQNKELRFGTFVFGPVVMRSYYHLGKIDEALAAFHNPELEGFFDQMISHQLLLDMLYNNGRYSEVRQTYDFIMANHPRYGITMYPKFLVTLVLAACYKENTQESFEYATELWHKLKERDQTATRRICTFFAGLALNQNKPDIALQVIANLVQNGYITVLNLKVACLADLNRLDGVVSILKSSLAFDNPAKTKHFYTPEVIDKVEKAIERTEANENDDLRHLIQQLRENGHTTDNTLDKLITLEIISKPRDDYGSTGNRTDSRQDNRNNYERGFGGYRNDYQRGNRDYYQQGKRYNSQQRNQNDYQQGYRNNYHQRDRRTNGAYKNSNYKNDHPGLSELV